MVYELLMLQWSVNINSLIITNMIYRRVVPVLLRLPEEEVETVLELPDEKLLPEEMLLRLPDETDELPAPE